MQEIQVMLDDIENLLKLENKKKIKCLHNEVKIIYALLKNGPTSSLAIMRLTNRSISAHNSDLKRLVALGAIRQVDHDGDGRVKLYDVNREYLKLDE
jgi:predicted transcriptional regulator